MIGFLYKLLVIFALPMFAIAQINVLNDVKPTSVNIYDVENLDTDRSLYLGYDKDLSPQLQGKFQEIDIMYNMFSNVYWTSGNAFVYEPKSGTLIFAQTSRHQLPDGSDTANFTGIIHIYTSQDYGTTWQKHEVYNKWGHIPANPAVAVLNPNNSTNPADFKYVLSTRYFIPNMSSGQPINELQGALYLLYEGNNWQFLEYPEAGPLTNNPGQGQKWALMNSVASDAKNGNWYYTAGVLSPANNFIQYGSYGVNYIGLDVADVGSFIPNHFGFDQFRPSTSTTTSYQSQMEIDVDVNGNVYTAVNNYFLPYDEIGRNRVVGVAKSIDNGKSYSQFEKMSLSVIDNFITLKGGSPTIGIPIPGQYPYGSNGFRVTGEDEYSFIYRIYSSYGTEEGQFDTYIVEAFRKDGQWGMREISTFSGNKWRIPYVIQDTNATLDQDVFTDNPRQHELQLSMTADGQYLVAKWIDNRDELACLDPRVTIVGSGFVDSMLTTDIYISYRPINGTQWSPVQNLTNDLWMNKSTIIPPIIPSLDKIPIIEYATVRFTNPEDPRYSYPYFVQNFVVGTSVRQHILAATYDATNPSTISNPTIQIPEGLCGVQSINEEDLNFRLFNITPNPVNDEAYINYQLDYPGDVSIDIYNALGQKVLNVRNAYTQEGLWQANFSAAKLPIGTYYCNLNFNGRSVTKPIYVVR